MGDFDPLGSNGDSATSSRALSPVLVDRGRRLFEFLAASQRLRLSAVRTTDTYERDGAVHWLGGLPQHSAISGVITQEAPTPDSPILTVGRVAVVDPPTPPSEIQEWLDGRLGDPERAPELRESRRQMASEGSPEGAVVWLTDHPDLRVTYARWLTSWDAWASKEREDRPARELYKSLFGTYNMAANQPEEFELVVGVGCLAWAPAGHDRVRRHMLVSPAGIEYDKSTGELTVSAQPALDVLTVELDMLEPALAPAAQLRQDFVERARSHEVHPLDRVVTGDLVRRLVYSLDADGRFDEGDAAPAVTEVPTASFAPALILRKRSQLGLVAVFDRIAAAIAQAGEVPSGLLPLLDPDYRPVVERDPTDGAMIDIDDEVFLPLPLNDRQLDIIRRVDSQAQTLVQGPPGTGKTHLAAALISHLLAQGKRVLVTAHTDRALKEVRGKLPPEIRPLAVAVVGTDRSDMADLKVAVEHISTRSSDEDPEALSGQAKSNIADCLARIDVQRRARAGCRTRLVDARAGDVAERSFAGYSGTLAAIARTYQERAEGFSWLSPLVSPGVADPPPLADDEAMRWLELLRDTDVQDDEAEASRRLVDLATVPSPEQFAVLVDREASTSDSLAASAGWADHPAYEAVCGLDATVRADLQQRLTVLARHIKAFEGRPEPWMGQALNDLRTGRGATWDARAAHVTSLLTTVWNALQSIGWATRVTVWDGADRTAIGSLARYLHQYVQANGPVKVNPDGSVKLGTFAGKAVKNSKLLFDAVRVDGQPPTTTDRLSAVIVHLDVERQLEALDKAWPADVAVPAEDTLQERYQWHATELQQLQALLIVGNELAAEHQRIAALGLPQPDWSDLRAVLAFASLVDAAAARDAHASATWPLRHLVTLTSEGVETGRSAEASDVMAHAVVERDRDTYTSAYHRTRWLHLDGRWLQIVTA
jgi:hypothetical protein